jgi:hypothetical protein
MFIMLRKKDVGVTKTYFNWGIVLTKGGQHDAAQKEISVANLNPVIFRYSGGFLYIFLIIWPEKTKFLAIFPNAAQFVLATPGFNPQQLNYIYTAIIRFY